MSVTRALALACAAGLLGGCARDQAVQVNLVPSGNTGAAITSVTLYGYGPTFKNGSPLACDDFLRRALPPQDSGLDLLFKIDGAPGERFALPPSGRSPLVLYLEGHRADPTKVAVGCTVLDRLGSQDLTFALVEGLDADKDGLLGRFTFADGVTALGPDCDDNNPAVHPGAVEAPCSGDVDCDHQTACDHCLTNADCSGNAQGACCEPASGRCVACGTCQSSVSPACTAATKTCCRWNMSTTQCDGYRDNACLCDATAECPANKCCLSKAYVPAAAMPLSPGVCVKVDPMAAHPGWCACAHDGECQTLFAAASGVCCVAPAMVCGVPRPGTSEHCAP